MRFLKYLLFPVWLILFILKWGCLCVTGFISVFLRVLGIGALSVGVVLLMIGTTLRPLAGQLLISGTACVLLPFLGSVITGVLEAGHTLLWDYMTD